MARSKQCAGFGGKVAQALRQHGIATVAALQSVSVASLQELCSLPAATAYTLSELSFGRDTRVPRLKLPPKAFSLQMSLTPIAIPMHPSWSANGMPSEVGGVKSGMLQPLFLNEPDANARMMSLLSLMLKDLLIRVVQDRCASWDA
jgi:hypothetical protein